MNGAKDDIWKGFLSFKAFIPAFRLISSWAYKVAITSPFFTELQIFL
jgi:hypothetical protein